MASEPVQEEHSDYSGESGKDMDDMYLDDCSDHGKEIEMLVGIKLLDMR